MALPKTNIEKYRRLKFMTQAEVAKKVGMSVVNYSKYEREERRLTVELALKLVDVFGLSQIEELLLDSPKSAV